MQMPAFVFMATGFAILLTLSGCGAVSALTSSNAPKDEGRQGLVLGPVLQNAKPDGIGIMWETIGGADSVVEYGPTTNLGHYAQGDLISGPGQRVVHHVDLTQLTPDTKYFYRVVPVSGPGRIHTFRTPPAPGTRKNFKFAVYSDCQQKPGTHRQIVDQGIFGSLPRGAELSDELGFVLVAGDIVQDGDIYGEYEERFFDPIENISSSVPYYVAIGNHERNATHYFNYMNLPRNGTPGFEEHWYSFDYGNAHVIGLDTNRAYSIDEQLNWLDADLTAACQNPHVEMIFAFFHHPYKSEAWVPGEHGYAGKIVRQMEQQLTACDKVGAYFFGHTHAYSRGQSQDANLYWVNVGTAGGDIDYWGEFEQRDYPEFQKSFDEYGVLMVEANPDGKTGFAATRLSFGDDKLARRGDVQDHFAITKENQAPMAPTIDNVAWNGVQIAATASAFGDLDSTQHLEAQWQVAATADFAKPLSDQWLRFENWFMDVDTNAGLDITQAKLDVSGSHQSLWTRVRYRDDQLRWSPWSAPYQMQASQWSAR